MHGAHALATSHWQQNVHICAIPTGPQRMGHTHHNAHRHLTCVHTVVYAIPTRPGRMAQAGA